MISSSTSFRRILFSNSERFFDSIDDEVRNFCDCDSCDYRRDCDDEVRNKVFNDREKDVSILIQKKNFDLLIRRSSDENNRMIRESD